MVKYPTEPLSLIPLLRPGIIYESWPSLVVRPLFPCSVNTPQSPYLFTCFGLQPYGRKTSLKMVVEHHTGTCSVREERLESKR